MHKGKLIADSGNTEFTKVDEIKNLEDFMNLIENSDVDGSESDEQLNLAKFKILASEEIRSKVELDAIDIGLNTQVIMDNNQNIDEAQILAYAKKMGLTKRQSNCSSKILGGVSSLQRHSF